MFHPPGPGTVAVGAGGSASGHWHGACAAHSGWQSGTVRDYGQGLGIRGQLLDWPGQGPVPGPGTITGLLAGPGYELQVQVFDATKAWTGHGPRARSGQPEVRLPASLFFLALMPVATIIMRLLDFGRVTHLTSVAPASGLICKRRRVGASQSPSALQQACPMSQTSESAFKVRLQQLREKRLPVREVAFRLGSSIIKIIASLKKLRRKEFHVHRHARS